MIDDWEHGYIHADKDILLQYLLDNFPDPTAEKGYKLPGDMSFKSEYLRPMEKTGTITDGLGVTSDVYSPIIGRTDILVFVSARNGGLYMYDELALIGGVDVHKGVTLAEIQSLYPEFCLGQAIPHVS